MFIIFYYSTNVLLILANKNIQIKGHLIVSLSHTSKPSITPKNKGITFLLTPCFVRECKMWWWGLSFISPSSI